MSEDLQQQKFVRLTTAPVEKLVCRMAIPSMISMLVSAFYNMADTFFIGKISTQATGAIGIVFSYMALIQAVAFFFGHGGGTYISRELGKQRVEQAERMAANSFFLSLCFGVLFAVLGFLFMSPFLRFLGATETILPEAESYFTYILLASPFIMGSFVLNNLMRMQGNAHRATIGIAAGAVLNVVLDPILIFGFELGIQGAAIATAISQVLGFFLLLYMSDKGGGIRIQIRLFSPDRKVFSEITAGGMPSLCRQGLASLAAVCLNNVAGVYGDSAIAAFSVVNRIFMMANSGLIGFGQGFQPVCGFNYGAQLYDRVRKAFWFCVKISTVALLVLGAGIFLFAEPIVTAFRADDPELVRIAVRALRYQCAVFPLLGWITIVNMYLQNIRHTVPATIVAAARQGIVLIPVLYLMVPWFGLNGLLFAQPVADLLTFGLAIPFGLSALRGMRMSNKPSDSK